MSFILRLIIGGMLASLGRDIYSFTKSKLQRTAAWQYFIAEIDRTFNTVEGFLKHIFAIKIN